ncbi:autotransporter beta-domain-containing protein [Campylobacter jejuni subsp. doylei]|nr:autotransporter beta-domain-containing protein [Campylobacter jejuni subsp. doylei]
MNNISYYTGLKYFNTLFTTAKGQEVYIKAQVQAALIKNDFTKRIGKNEAKAKAHSYTYGINTALGMNFIADKTYSHLKPVLLMKEVIRKLFPCKILEVKPLLRVEKEPMQTT